MITGKATVAIDDLYVDPSWPVGPCLKAGCTEDATFPLHIAGWVIGMLCQGHRDEMAGVIGAK